MKRLSDDVVGKVKIRLNNKRFPVSKLVTATKGIDISSYCPGAEMVQIFYAVEGDLNLLSIHLFKNGTQQSFRFKYKGSSDFNLLNNHKFINLCHHKLEANPQRLARIISQNFS